MAGAWPERGRREQGGRGGQRRCEEAGRESVRGSGAQASGVGGAAGGGGPVLSITDCPAAAGLHIPGAAAPLG